MFNPIGAIRSIGGAVGNAARGAWDKSWGFTKEVLHLDQLGQLAGEMIDEFSGMLRWAASEAFKVLTEPLRKALEPWANDAGWKFPKQWLGKQGIAIIDGVRAFIEGKATPDFMGSGMGIDQLAAAVMQQFPGLRITSGYRPGSITASGNLSYHARDMARDLGGPAPLMAAAGKWMQDTMYGDLLEGIHNPTLAVKNYRAFPPPGPYAGVVWGGHRDHIHMAAEKEGKPGDLGASAGAPGGSGTGVQRWAGLVNQIAGQVNFPRQFIPIFMRQMQSESGGQNVVQQIVDVNTGDRKARGLMQVTWMAAKDYYPPAAGMSPAQINAALMNPNFNIAASMVYMMRRYGARIPAMIGRGHGYAAGGIIREPVTGVGMRSGDPYTFAERGPELVSPLSRRGGWSNVEPLAGDLGRTVTVNVHPSQGMSEERLAAAVARELEWAYAGGRV